ncbi:hypothetical protein QJU43_04470 [Pasteurella atlantica]|uniref:hypothetical protein n=1 Tax=Pasteurellaceae TaxID=712 RepID=UPI00274E18E8|nr:hypothetical protein [Pasteurella atlantica]MDP8033620.1 hypothetical protein [Pasteurella atlantica]MDP8035600.1 hypothetical protein [Pasteurella atlantica]MDP8037551.1 hypothetical protein [Pasteurella atlantica]MDP8047900.1 hypothetical protein [Pasteurella atlantica]MDP8049855.1 hypothetical protein [Pasteurella atlantica]
MKIFKQVTANNIELKPYPFKKELAMEAYLIENEDILTLDQENFTEVAILDEEIALKKGRRNRDGRIDILASYGAEYLSIVELKLNEINIESLKQLEDYLDERKQILEIGEYWENNQEPKWIGVLVGTSISEELQIKLRNGYKYNDEIPIAGIVLSRYRSEDNNIFVISDTYFSFNYSTKDYSRFIFKSKILNKAQLVNEVVKAYVEDNPNVTFAELKSVFPDKYQKNYGIFDKYAKAYNIYSESGYKRYYIKDVQTINLIDEKIATCNQWNSHSIASFIKLAKELGYSIELK